MITFTDADRMLHYFDDSWSPEFPVLVIYRRQRPVPSMAPKFGSIFCRTAAEGKELIAAWDFKDPVEHRRQFVRAYLIPE